MPSTSVSFKCPECGLVVTVESTPPVFIHPFPTCKRFDECQSTEDMVLIMREARLKEEAGVS